ncbi:hypothetical protein [Nocardia sp. CA-290969]|uniref:hypothetical protein n=1 Tax=Nocardia sp. CA-290969 TaxID=3239986 RepID=UPI003D8A1968
MSGENQWEKLRDRAAGGGFAFDTNAGVDAAGYCADLANVYVLVENGIAEVENVRGLGHLPGAERLADKLSECAGDFRQVLKEHKRIVTDLGIAFILADKKYQGTDSDAARRFRDLTGDSTSHAPLEHIEMVEDGTGRWRPDYSVPTECVDPDSKYGPPEGLGKSRGVERQSLGISVPPAVGMGYNDLWRLGQALSGHTDSLAMKGTGWNRMSLQLETGFSGFDQKMLRLVENSDRWKGQGAEGAALAVRSYVNRGQSLLSAMSLLGENLQAAAVWTYQTAAFMPAFQWNEQSVYTVDYQRYQWETLSLARTAYENWYEPGIHAAAAAVPVMPSPITGTRQANGAGSGSGDTGGNAAGGSANGSGAAPAGASGAVPGGAPALPAGTGGAPALPTGSAGVPTPGLPTGGQPGAVPGAPNPKPGRPAPDQPPGSESPAQRELQAIRRELATTRRDLELAQRQLEAQVVGISKDQWNASKLLRAQAQQQQQQAAMQAMQQGLSAVGQALPQLSSAAQQVMQQFAANGPGGLAPALQEAAKRYHSALDEMGKALGGSGAGGSSGAGLGAGSKPPQLPAVEQASRLFPRAASAGMAHGMSTSAVTAGPSRMPMGGAPMGGAPMGGGGGGAGAGTGQSQGEHKPADFLDTDEWLEDAIGEHPFAVRPVLET